ncbi:MAG: 3-keto-5-aminohexanoate cleavage protein [Rhizobiaceae bacterium]
MVAPNGARLTKKDHPKLPVTVEEIVACARDCHVAGAGALHAHVRDINQVHVLDAGLYRELIDEMAVQAPGMHVQITTEAVGGYSPEEQRKLVRDVMPAAVSVSLSEMFSDGDRAAAIGFYQWAAAAGIAVQHIVYGADEFSHFIEMANPSGIPGGRRQVLFVLGRYAAGQQSEPSDLEPFLEVLETEAADLDIDWAVCAFGVRQQDCLLEAIRRGGKARVGFENGFWLGDGGTARENVSMVEDLVNRIAYETRHWSS